MCGGKPVALKTCWRKISSFQILKRANLSYGRTWGHTTKCCAAPFAECHIQLQDTFS
ncbi:unnamed protein product [Larinioides sclopetarius]|uniref:Uncharacterized protein n=1 Tax=Larinioides sclopetarius TaxID=280406 RepID=A0AAV2C1Q2_9ARAC